ncbi:hypothetical protein NECAME_16418 [Necator americanus]|uniref:HSac2 domain-containing protein n=1 Tax=Necator americanus TaxID=51031 RepID=W2TZ09_NECAM|nr:hypothetical protein NECAME_16418 [Necator americanus]ETN86291.1 hypothetical protein NECAME_16418 [Necator americanus]
MVDSDSDSEEDENVSRLVAETVHFLIPEGEVVVGGWALCDSLQKGDAIDTILLLTRTKLYVAVYDDELEKLADVRIVPLDDITSLEVGRPSRSARLFLRVTCLEESWTWRAGKTRLFNNVAIRLKTLEEAGEYTESIAEQISVTINLCVGRDVPVQRVERLTLPGSTNTAKRALASMTAALKTRMRRPAAPSGTNTTNSNDNVAAESLPVPTTVVDSSLIDISENCGPVDSVSEFRDDMNPNTTTIAPSKIHTSPSDGCLLTEANRPATSVAGLVGRIRGLKTPFTRSNEGSGASANPFKNLLPLMSTSQTNFVML